MTPPMVDVVTTIHPGTGNSLRVLRGQRTAHFAVADADHGWILTWLPNRRLTRRQAVVGLRLADELAGGLDVLDERGWVQYDFWAAELGLIGVAAVSRALIGPPHGDVDFAVAPLNQNRRQWRHFMSKRSVRDVALGRRLRSVAGGA
jgi:hypothetical protein